MLPVRQWSFLPLSWPVSVLCLLNSVFQLDCPCRCGLGFTILSCPTPSYCLITDKGSGSFLVSRFLQLLVHSWARWYFHQLDHGCFFGDSNLSAFGGRLLCLHPSLPAHSKPTIKQTKRFSQLPDKFVCLLICSFKLKVWGYMHLTSLTTPFKAL